jgi:hypothetical protein
LISAPSQALRISKEAKLNFHLLDLMPRETDNTHRKHADIVHYMLATEEEGEPC